MTTDVFTRKKRSEVMSRIRGRDNKDTELALRTLLRQAQLTGWRRHLKVFGRPDFAFPKARLAVFIDGCFWHGCPRCYRAPKQNGAFWADKIGRNRTRDRLVTRILKSMGWTVVRIWECALRRRPEGAVDRIRKGLDEAR